MTVAMYCCPHISVGHIGHMPWTTHYCGDVKTVETCSNSNSPLTEQ